MGNGFNWACTWLYCVSNCIFVGVHSCLVLIRPRKDGTDGLRADWQQQFFVSLKMVDYCVLFFKEKKWTWFVWFLFKFWFLFGRANRWPGTSEVDLLPAADWWADEPQPISGTGSVAPVDLRIRCCFCFLFVNRFFISSARLLVCFFGRLVCWWARSRDPSQTSEMSETEQSKATAISGSEK